MAPAMLRWSMSSVSWATLMAAIFLALPARAEGWFGEGEVGVGTGMEGGDAGGAVAWQRARTRLFGGFELGWTESDRDALGWRFTAELERRLSLGGEVRYVRRFGDVVSAHAGGSCVVVPDSLYGGTLGATFKLPLGPIRLFLEPSLAAFVAGTDLPRDTVVIWASLNGGLRFDL